ncbi:hypothetical protein SCB29_13950 [Paraburkholderia sp. SIMBA_055]
MKDPVRRDIRKSQREQHIVKKQIAERATQAGMATHIFHRVANTQAAFGLRFFRQRLEPPAKRIPLQFRIDAGNSIATSSAHRYGPPAHQPAHV